MTRTPSCSKSWCRSCSRWAKWRGFSSSCCARGFRSAIWARFWRRCSRPLRRQRAWSRWLKPHGRPGTQIGSGSGRWRRPASGAFDRRGTRRGDSGHGRAGRRAAAAGRWRACANIGRPPPDRFCEIPYRCRLFLGTARAPLSQSGPLLCQALAGPGAAAPGGGRGQ